MLKRARTRFNHAREGGPARPPARTRPRGPAALRSSAARSGGGASLDAAVGEGAVFPGEPGVSDVLIRRLRGFAWNAGRRNVMKPVSSTPGRALAVGREMPWRFLVRSVGAAGVARRWPLPGSTGADGVAAEGGAARC